MHHTDENGKIIFKKRRGRPVDFNSARTRKEFAKVRKEIEAIKNSQYIDRSKLHLTFN